MPTGKRASMREGPLAALFSKTSEELPQEDVKQLDTRAKSRRADAEREPAAQQAGRI